MKKLVLLTLFVCNLFALGGVGALPKNTQKIVKQIEKNLDLSSANAYKVFKVVEGFFDPKNNWSMHYNVGTDLANAKFQNSPNKTMFMTILVHSRMANVSFIKFPKAKQVLVYLIQTIPTSSTLSMDMYDIYKKKTAYKQVSDTSRYASFLSKEYVHQVNIFNVPPSVGSVQYVDMKVVNLK